MDNLMLPTNSTVVVVVVMFYFCVGRFWRVCFPGYVLIGDTTLCASLRTFEQNLINTVVVSRSVTKQYWVAKMTTLYTITDRARRLIRECRPQAGTTKQINVGLTRFEHRSPYFSYFYGMMYAYGLLLTLDNEANPCHRRSPHPS